MPRARQDLERMRQAARERHPSTLRTLCHRLAQLGDFAEAARAQRELVAMSVGAWDTAGAWRKLAELERRAEDYPAAWTALRECQRVLSHVPGWTECGLGWHYVQELFELACAANTIGSCGTLSDVASTMKHAEPPTDVLPTPAVRTARCSSQALWPRARVYLGPPRCRRRYPPRGPCRSPSPRF